MSTPGRCLGGGSHLCGDDTGTYGSYVMTAAGAWTYTLDNDNATGSGSMRRPLDRHLER